MLRIILLIFLLASNGASVFGSLEWHTGTQKYLLMKAKKEDRNIFLYWGASWCSPCLVAKNQIHSSAKIMNELKSFQLVHVDFDSKEAKEWSQSYPPEGLPTFIIIGADGRIRSKINGVLNEESFVKILKYYKKNDKPFESNSPNFNQIKNADILREVLAKRWAYMDSLGPFDSADEKTEFYRKLKSANFNFDTEIYLRDKATIQYMLVNSRVNNTLPHSEVKELLSWLNSFLNDSSRIKAQVWELSELFSIAFKLLEGGKHRHSLASKLKFYALNKDLDFSILERLLLIKTYVGQISQKTSSPEKDLIRLILSYYPIPSKQSEIFNKISD